MRTIARSAAALAVAGGVLAATGGATTPVGEQFRVSAQGVDGDTNFDATDAVNAYNSTDNEYLVAWTGTATVGETEVYARLMAADGSPIGAPFRISDMGPDGDGSYGVATPAVAYNSAANEYLVAWRGDDNTGLLVDGELEIFVQRLSADGVEIGADTRVSNMGPDGNQAYDASDPAVAYNSTANEYVVSWHGDDDTLPLVDDEDEIFIQRLSADAAEIGGDVRVSDAGPDGDTTYDALRSAITYNSVDNEYLVAWRGQDDAGALGLNETEIYVQRLSGTAAELGTDTRVSDMGADGNQNLNADFAAIAHNPTANEYLVTWHGDDDSGDLADDEFEIYAQRLTAAATEVGTDLRVSTTNVDGNDVYDALAPSAAYNAVGNEYLVTWHADSDVGDLVNDEFEIYGQRLGPEGAAIEDATRLSAMGPDGDTDFNAFRSVVSHNSTANEYFVSWHGDDNTGALAAAEFEVYARRVMGGAAPVPPPPGTPPGGGIPGTSGAPSAANCVAVEAVTGKGASGKLTLTATQLRINQRIGQAAVRRANAVQNWVDAGIVNGDLCGGSLIGDQLDAGVMFSQGLLQAVPGKADPRPVVIPAAQAKPAATFTLTAEQLKINQNVYSAAVRRANALKARIEGQLTGGDIKDGELTADRLRQDLALETLTAAASVPGASTTQVADPDTKTAVFTPTLRQLRINQKIAQAAVKRTNELRATVGAGLKGENFAAKSITAVDWTAPTP